MTFRPEARQGSDVENISMFSLRDTQWRTRTDRGGRTIENILLSRPLGSKRDATLPGILIIMKLKPPNFQLSCDALVLKYQITSSHSELAHQFAGAHLACQFGRASTTNSWQTDVEELTVSGLHTLGADAQFDCTSLPPRKTEIFGFSIRGVSALATEPDRSKITSATRRWHSLQMTLEVWSDKKRKKSRGSSKGKPSWNRQNPHSPDFFGFLGRADYSRLELIPKVSLLV